MKGTPAIYLGRLVSKENFRVFIFAPDGSQKLVESWDDFEKHMEGGLWFASLDDAKASQAQEEKAEVKPKASKAKKEPVKASKVVDVESAPLDGDQDDLNQDVAFEVGDDFLPKGK